MREKIIKLFKIRELPKEQQERIAEKYRDINVDYENWWECTVNNFADDVEDIGFQIPVGSVSFQLHCQGSGVAFEGYVDMLKFIDSIDPNKKIYPRTRELFKEGAFEISIIRTDMRYCHEYSMDVDIRYNYEEDEQDELKDSLGRITEGRDVEDTVGELGTLVLEKARELSKELYNKLDKEYDYLTSDESVIETLHMNEYEFEMDSTEIRR